MADDKKAKRSFERRDGVLNDDYTDESGRDMRMYKPDLPPDGDERKERLRKIEGGNHEAQYSMHFDDSPDVLEAILKGIEAGEAPSIDLLKHVDDPRVRPLILEASKRAQIEERGSENALQLVGMVGGEGATDILREKMRVLAADPSTWIDDSFFNSRAGVLKTVCEGLLRLDPQATDAADLLVRLFDHPCAFNRRRAAAMAAGVYERTSHTEANRALRRRFEQLAESDDDELFLEAAPAMVWVVNEEFEERCTKIFENGSPEVQDSVLHALSQAAIPFPGKSFALVLRAIEQATTLRRKTDLAGSFGRFLPASIAEDLARPALADESPSLRLQGCGLLHYLDPDTAKELATEALADEPDPYIIVELKKAAGLKA
jgi:hypothetical protein